VAYAPFIPSRCRQGRDSAAVLLVAACLCCAAGAWAGPAADPSVRLYDTGAGGRAAAAEDFAARKGWVQVPEGRLDRAFAGDAVLMNDRCAVVVRRSGVGASVYAAAAGGWQERAHLLPEPAAGQAQAGAGAAQPDADTAKSGPGQAQPAARQSQPAAIACVANDAGAVEVEASGPWIVAAPPGPALRPSPAPPVPLPPGGQAGPAGGGARCRFRLTAGEAIVEVRPAAGVAALLVASSLRYVVVPDFFGDDVVLSAAREAAGTARVFPAGLPAERMLLAPLDGGEAMLFCAWEASDATADLVFVGEMHKAGFFAEGRGGTDAPAPGPPEMESFGVFRVSAAPGKRVWLACLQGAGMWQAAPAGAARAGEARGGEPPAGGGRAGLPAEASAKAGEFVRGFRPPMPARWRADFVGPGGMCDSVTFDEAPPAALPVPDDWRGEIVLYPIDRTRQTPLAAILPTDVLRFTLGVGPCQYVLDAEGLGSADAPATPDAVIDWIERLAKRGQAAAERQEIEARLRAMLDHLAAARARIGDYAAFGRQVRAACAAVRSGDASSVRSTGAGAAASGAGRAEAAGDADAADAAALLAICDRLDHDIARGQDGLKTAEDAGRLVGQMLAAIDKGSAAAELAKVGGELRAIGAAHDALLARARMAARRVAATLRFGRGDLAKKVLPMAEAVLRKR